MATVTHEADAIENDLNATRARLDSRISELVARLSPGQILDETLRALRTREGADFARNLGEAVRERPIPAALMGIGLAWLMAGPRDHAVARTGGHTSSAPDYDLTARAWQAGRNVVRREGESDSAFRERVNEARGKVLQVLRNANETAESYAERVQEALFAARSRAAEAVSAATARAGDVGAQMGRAAQDAAQGLGERAQALRDAAAETGARLRSAVPGNGDLGASAGRAAAALGETPVLLGALGLAAGTVLGGLLPITETERDVLREQSHTLAAGLSEAARVARDRGAEVAQAALKAGQDTAREAAGHVQELGRAAGDASRDVAGQAVQAAGDLAAKHGQAAKDFAAQTAGAPSQGSAGQPEPRRSE